MLTIAVLFTAASSVSPIQGAFAGEEEDGDGSKTESEAEADPECIASGWDYELFCDSTSEIDDKGSGTQSSIDDPFVLALPI